ncbi:hypothetical protein M413DRAFT_7067 [Hebeloma cylindrosporum]|uniref:Las1-domain-containing protein n=1 Tax=Hebeloma cylindrosporum TaxID=76867 RepID=A0A0C3CGQ3_HEBCY|nr:hypothetical protein M413DRAFT_7067 [Hebeloma cylindrosporum h7]
MRLPRRVPWSSLAELDNLCASIYADENDISSKIYAINRISAWKAVTPIPHALESTLALLVVVVQDSQRAPIPAIFFRQSYAAAIIRLVNGLVDPLQVSTYARSITSIAQQLGIPSWLVELRHAATHEDLPSLDLLREAARQAMAWLLQNYFFPLLNPVSNNPPILTPVRPLAPLLKLYKNTMKIVTRDLSLMTRHKPRLGTILRDIEKWIAETRVSADAAMGETRWQTNHWADGDETAEGNLGALEQLCKTLAEKGMLVPLAKKKRQLPRDGHHPTPASISHWETLLLHLQAAHPDFPYILCKTLTSILLDTISSGDTVNNQHDPSYYTYIACWVTWIVETWKNIPDLKVETLSILMKGLGYDSSAPSQKTAAFDLLKRLCNGLEEMEAVTLLLSTGSSKIPQTWGPLDLDMMKKRHEQLQSHLYTDEKNSTQPDELIAQPAKDVPISGWCILVENRSWKSCPVGIYNEN